jgi:hypothetical protein
MQLVQGKEPLHRFLDARHAVQAVLARKRFAGRTFGRPMMVWGDVWTKIRGPTTVQVPANWREQALVGESGGARPDTLG